MDGLAIAASLQEVRAAEGGFLRSIYQPTRSAFVLHVFAGRNRRILLAPRHAAIHVTELGLANPPEPSSFVMLLRRHLRGGRILAVRQRGWDRVVTFDIERREGRAQQDHPLVSGRQRHLLAPGRAVAGDAPPGAVAAFGGAAAAGFVAGAGADGFVLAAGGAGPIPGPALTTSSN